jgi:hypothetical protein
MPTDFAPDAAPAAAKPLFAGAALLDAEKLDCYRLAVEFQALAVRLLPKRRALPDRTMPPSNGLELTKPAQAMELRCSTGSSTRG